MTNQTIAPVTFATTVPLPPEKAFELFTAGIDAWWIRSNSIGATPMRTAVLEARSGGRWYEIGEDGTECDWGKVLVYDPPHRLVLAWQLTNEWTYDPDLVTEVEVRFADAGDGRTHVDLEHRGLERLGASAAGMREAFMSPNGWPGLLRRYVDAA